MLSLCWLTVSIALVAHLGLINRLQIAAHPVPCRPFRNCSLTIIPDNDWQPIVPYQATGRHQPIRHSVRSTSAKRNRLNAGVELPALPNHYTNLHSGDHHWNHRLDNWQYAEPRPGEPLFPPVVQLLRPRRARRHFAVQRHERQRNSRDFRPTAVPLRLSTPTVYPFHASESIDVGAKNSTEHINRSTLPFGFEPSMYTKPVRVNYRANATTILPANHRDEDAQVNMLVPISTTLKVHRNNDTHPPQLTNSQQKLFVVTSSTTSTSSTTTTSTTTEATPRHLAHRRTDKAVHYARYGGFLARGDGGMQPVRRNRRPHVFTLGRLIRLDRRRRRSNNADDSNQRNRNHNRYHTVVESLRPQPIRRRRNDRRQQTPIGPANQQRGRWLIVPR